MTLHQELTPFIKGGALLRRRTWAWIALGGVLIAILAAVQVTITGPRVQVRWREGVSSADRTAVERRYELRNGVPAGDGWRYEQGDLSRENIRALIQDPAVDDTGYIDRDALTSEGRDIRVTVWHPFGDLFDRPSQLLQLHQSLWLLLAGGVLLRAARASSARGRRNMTVATLLLVGMMTVAFPIDPSFVTMGEWYEHGQRG